MKTVTLQCEMNKETAQVIAIALQLLIEDLNRIIDKGDGDAEVALAYSIAAYVHKDLSHKVETWPSEEEYDRMVLAAFKDDGKPN